MRVATDSEETIPPSEIVLKVTDMHICHVRHVLASEKKFLMVTHQPSTASDSLYALQRKDQSVDVRESLKQLQKGPFILWVEVIPL